MRTRIILFGFALAMIGACSQVETNLSYETLSDSEAESYRQAIYGPKQEPTWKKTNSRQAEDLGVAIGQDKDEFDAIIKSTGFQPVGGQSHGMPYSCTPDPCRCSESRTINYVRTTDVSKSFEAIALQYGPQTFEGVCRPGLFNISPVDFYEKT